MWDSLQVNMTLLDKGTERMKHWEEELLQDGFDGPERGIAKPSQANVRRIRARSHPPRLLTGRNRRPALTRGFVFLIPPQPRKDRCMY